jgi:cytochrome c oxidase subunit 3
MKSPATNSKGRHVALRRSIGLLSSRREMYQAHLVFYLLMASFTMFFLAGIAAYCVIRSETFDPAAGMREYLPLKIPTVFWVSSAVLIATGVCAQRAVWLVRRQRLVEFRSWLWVTLLMALAFIVFQAIGLAQLVEAHRARGDGSAKAYALCFTMSLLHAVHVVGGIGFLGYVLVQSYRDRYDHERHWAVDNMAGYWHFLDLVWLAFLGAFLIVR